MFHHLSPRAILLCAFVACAVAGNAHALDLARALLDSIPNGPSPELKLKLEKQEAIALQQVKQLQSTLDGIRNNTEQGPAKIIATDVKEEELQRARRTFVEFQAARQIVSGAETTLTQDEIKEILPYVMESIWLPSNPMLPTCGVTLPYRGDGVQAGWQSLLDDFLTKHGAKLAAVGRIEIETEVYVPSVGMPVKKTQIQYVGSGFAIGERAVMTAGHVASMFLDPVSKQFRTEVKKVYFNTGAELEYNCKNANAGSRRVSLKSLSNMKHQPQTYPRDFPMDYATFAVADDESPLASFLPLSNAGDAPAGSFVIVVEFPGDDPSVNKIRWRDAMNVPTANGMYPETGIKRIAPGMVMNTCDNASASHVPHDATTLNRSSGAPIFDASTGKLVGMQVAGYRNLSIEGKYCNLGLKSNLPEIVDIK